MISLRFVAIFAVAIAGWIVIMWLTLSAMEAAQNAEGEHPTRTPAPATVEKQAEPHAGARSMPDGVVRTAYVCNGDVA